MENTQFVVFHIKSYEDTGNFKIVKRYIDTKGAESHSEVIIEDSEVKLKHLLTLLYESGNICTYTVKSEQEKIMSNYTYETSNPAGYTYEIFYSKFSNVSELWVSCSFKTTNCAIIPHLKSLQQQEDKGLVKNIKAVAINSSIGQNGQSG